MYHQIVIYTTENIEINILNNYDYVIINDIETIAKNSLTCSLGTIGFDYFITSIFIDNFYFSDENFIITNHYFETSIDYHYAIGIINQSLLNINEQLKLVIDHFENPN